jgi:hypothetical protein
LAELRSVYSNHVTIPIVEIVAGGSGEAKGFGRISTALP